MLAVITFSVVSWLTFLLMSTYLVVFLALSFLVLFWHDHIVFLLVLYEIYLPKK